MGLRIDLLDLLDALQSPDNNRRVNKAQIAGPLEARHQAAQCGGRRAFFEATQSFALASLQSKMDADDIASIRSAPKTNTTRVRGETTEERRERKQTVKEERRERRQERKSNKTAFKDEKKRLDAQRSRVVVDGRPLR